MITSVPRKQRQSGIKSTNLYPLEGSSLLDITAGVPGSASGSANELRRGRLLKFRRTRSLFNLKGLYVGTNKSVDKQILQFPTEAPHPVRFLRHMTTQLLQEAAQVIPNQQLLINVVSKRVRQLGLGHRPMVETTPRMSLTDIALKEIVAGKLTYELVHESSDGA